MPYSQGRVVHDADAHIMETPTWLRDHAEAAFRDRLPVLRYPGGNELRQTGDPAEQQRDLEAAFERLRARHGSAEYRADEEAEIMARKNFAATGSFIPEDRPRALDLLGFSSQLVFNTFHNGRLHDLEHAGDVDLVYAAARAHNRGMLEFCSVDRSPPPVALCAAVRPREGGRRRPATPSSRVRPPCSSLPGARRTTPRATWTSTPYGRRPRRRTSPSSSTSAARATLIDKHYFANGRPIPPDFHGGEENFRSVDYMGIPVPPAQTLATLIFDGVLEAFPNLHIGVIEQGAIWVPSWLRQMESAFEAFRRHEERLQALSLTPSEYVHRQVRFTPYPTEDVGWIIDQAGADLVLFSSDYPHVEGGRKPLERFEASLGDRSDDVRRQFYSDNFVFLMGNAGLALAA